MDNFLIKLFLIILGLTVIRFGVLQFKKYRDSGMKTKNNLFDKIIFLLFFAVIIGLIFYSIQNFFSKAKAASLLIIDGDTIKLDGKKIRFSGIDAPESYYKGKIQTCIKNDTNVDCGKLSKNFLIELIGNNEIKCKLETTPDQYDRSLGECFVNGKSISRSLVRNGYAFDYPKYSKKKFHKDQEYAKSRKLGLWSMKFDFPWEFRRKN